MHGISAKVIDQFELAHDMTEASETDLVFATEWSAEQIAAGYVARWTTYHE